MTPTILTLLVLLVLVLPLAFLATRIVVSIEVAAGEDWSSSLDAAENFVSEQLSVLHQDSGVSVQQMRATIDRGLNKLGSSAAAWAGGRAGALPGQTLSAFLFVSALYFFLRDGRALGAWLNRRSPFSATQTDTLFQSIYDTVRGALLGMVAAAVTQGVAITIALFAFKVPAAMLFGALATFLAFIPVVGTTPVSAGACIYLLAIGRPGAAVGMLIAGIVIGLSDNIVRPWVQGAGQKELHPLFILLGIFGGLATFGITGVFLGPVVAAVAMWTIETYAPARRIAIESANTNGTARRDDTTSVDSNAGDTKPDPSAEPTPS